jgi:hypothetical protein
METPKKYQQTDDENEQSQTASMSSKDDAVEDDGTPVLDEKDLEENNLTVEEAENIVWDDPEGTDDDDMDSDLEDEEEDDDE